MPLDPKAEKFLAELNAVGAPPVHEQTPEEARASMLTTTGGLGRPQEVAHVENRSFAGPHGEVPVRVFRPSEESPLPAVVFYHGGGWVCGNLDTHDGLCRALANSARCVVVSVDYGLAPEHKYPVAADEAYAALKWVAEAAEELHVNPKKLAVCGDSAGGNLAAVTALQARDQGGPPLALQVLMYPATDCNFQTASYRDLAEGYMLTTAGMKWFWDHYLPSPETASEPYASPLRAESLENLAPALVITAEFDPLRDEGEIYAARLKEAGNQVALTRYDGMLHGFIRRLNYFDQAPTALEQMAAALRDAFGG